MFWTKSKSEKDYEQIVADKAPVIKAMEVMERTIDRLTEEINFLRHENNELKSQIKTQPVSDYNVINPQPINAPKLRLVSDVIRTLERKSLEKAKLNKEAGNSK